MKRYPAFIIVFLTISLSSLSLSEEQPNVAAAARLIEIMNVKSLMSETINKSLDAQLAVNPALVPYKATMTQFLEKYMGFESLKDEFIAIYTEAFSTEELLEITRFYETPIGKKVLSKFPELVSKGAALGQKHVQDHLPELREMIAKESERIQKMQNGTSK